MDTLNELIEKLSPVLLRPSESSLTIGISKRFFLFTFLKKMINIIEEEPHLNFIALLKNYKVLGNFLNGTLHEFYRDRNRIYFKNFFYDRSLYLEVKSDLEQLYPKYKDVKLTITKRGVIIYDNYRKGSFNALLMTIHSGTWVPEELERKMWISPTDRFKEEDVKTDAIYRSLVLDRAGIWIDNKQSRFVIDFNRALKNAIYANNSEEWVGAMWKEPITDHEKKEIYAGYREFYFTLTRLLESYQFNIILDGHSMKDRDGRPEISFGTKYIPTFYMPIVFSMQNKMRMLGYSPVLLDTPFKSGFILNWLHAKFPNIFICSMEINKRLYLSKDRLRPIQKKLDKLSQDISKVFDINHELNKKRR